MSGFSEEKIKSLRVGEILAINDVIYAARDAAHRRMIELLDAGKPLPFDVRGQAVYYGGPCPTPPGRIIGSVGPTTSGRMDLYAPRLIREGLRVMIGKGVRSREVVSAICECGGVYLAAVGGAGALLSQCVTKKEIVAFEDLGADVIYRLTVRDFPVVVAIDCKGGNIYENRNNRL